MRGYGITWDDSARKGFAEQKLRCDGFGFAGYFLKVFIPESSNIDVNHIFCSNHFWDKWFMDKGNYALSSLATCQTALDHLQLASTRMKYDHSCHLVCFKARSGGFP